MPRRGGRDRFRVNSRTMREVAARERMHAPPAEANDLRAAIVEAKRHENGRSSLPCTHGVVPWTKCTTCSMPRAR